RWEYIFLIAGSTVTDYLVAQAIHKSSDQRKRKLLLYFSLSLNLGLLFTFKYFDFFSGSVNAMFELANMAYMIPMLDVVLPVGISFYTFQTLSYTIDVYKGDIEPEKHFGIFALFVSFWPQLVAGPIERSSRLLPQFHKHHDFDYDRAVWALNRIAYGFFKKVVVADRLSIYVNEVYGDLDNYPTLPILLASFFFAFQIYCDFSGYTDIAIGCAALMGFTLMENFDRPYLSRSISEFWRRWHISLSSWFRDYVYIPMGGSRVVKWRWYYNLFITFLVSGLWHGAAWTFVVWGALHGIYLVIGVVSAPIRLRLFKAWRLDRWPKTVHVYQVLTTFFLVVVGWIFFRAGSMHNAAIVFGKILKPDLSMNPSILMAYQGPYNFLVSLMAVGMLAMSYIILPKNMKLKRNLLFLVATIIIILLFGKGGASEFIYFQF
ncbi:MAG TPA: MBOAT family protein, partial [Bacteroidetes bacterium]|nr:MBOAT family protein [Bacteroidota bacterium]